MAQCRIRSHCQHCHADYMHLSTVGLQVTIMPDEASRLAWRCPDCNIAQLNTDTLTPTACALLKTVGVPFVDVSDVQPERHADCGPNTMSDWAALLIEPYDDDLLACCIDMWQHET